MEKKKKRNPRKIILIESILIGILIISFFIISEVQKQNGKNQGNQSTLEKETYAKIQEQETNEEQVNKEQKNTEQLKKEEEKRKEQEIEQKKKDEIKQTYLAKAEILAKQYDYDAAIEHLKSYPENYEEIPEFCAAITNYETAKAECVPFGAYSASAEVSHIFFHSLIADTSKAFDNDYDSNGYNYYMTTISEFKEMMQQLYDQGYVLVSIHDVAGEVVEEDGTIHYKDGPIMLPPDKKPFVLSQDDVNYYDYMDNDGFATRMVIDENGRPSTEMLLEDGSVSVGDYDMVPVLETFLETHPDFSYRGARGLIALTGYEGALGYRTDPASKDSKTYEQDKETVREIAKVMREWGWEFACHSNGHRNMFTCTNEFLSYDTNQWLENVGSLVGETDVYIFPYGIDIENTVGAYTSNKFDMLYKAGFRYYCGVFKDPWIQVRDSYVRMTRRPLDGQAMLQFPERLADLFDLSTIIDSARPALK